MARLHGRNGAVYMAIASGGTAEPIPGSSSWSLSAASDKADVTAFGDSNKQYVAGLPDASGDFSGFYDDGSAQTYTAAQDGIARKFYLYPNRTNTAQYFWGTILPDFGMTTQVDGGETFTASWNAASTITKVG